MLCYELQADQAITTFHPCPNVRPVDFYETNQWIIQHCNRWRNERMKWTFHILILKFQINKWTVKMYFAKILLIIAGLVVLEVLLMLLMLLVVHVLMMVVSVRRKLHLLHMHMLVLMMMNYFAKTIIIHTFTENSTRWSLKTMHWWTMNKIVYEKEACIRYQKYVVWWATTSGMGLVVCVWNMNARIAKWCFTFWNIVDRFVTTSNN